MAKAGWWSWRSRVRRLSAAGQRLRPDFAALVLLGLAVLALCQPLVLDGLVLADFDTVAYFYPLYTYLAARWRQGEWPLWNPYLFAGVPFLANPQSGALYPPNLLFLFWPVERAHALSLWGHLWGAAIGAYLWGRLTARLSPLAALATAAVFGLGGYTVGLMGHLNQVQAAAYLPWLLIAQSYWVRQARPWALGLAGLLLGLQLLAGHVQVVYLTVWLLGLWTVGGLFQAFLAVRAVGGSWSALWREAAGQGLRLLLALGLGIGLAAPQLLPAWELAAEGIRAGGLSYADAVAFSLPPWLLPQTLLPVYQAEGQPFSEWVAYSGVLGLLLAGVGLLLTPGWRALGWGLVALLALGLALGQFNPLYPLLFDLVPGLRAFRVPARWLLLWSFALAVLAGLGVQALQGGARPDRWTLWRLAGLGGLGLLGGSLWWVGLHRLPERPALPPTAVWWVGLGVAGGLVALLCGLRPLARWRLWLLGGLVLGLVGELLVAARPLVLSRLGEPALLSTWRPTVAFLQTRGEGGRLLAISQQRFDPGDLPELVGVLQRRSRVAPALTLAAVKHIETLTPNLPLRYGLPSLDGYDGGLLPLRRFVDLKTLFPLTGPNLLDGRLGQQLQTLPESRLLRWLSVRWVVMDRSGDLWEPGLYFDRAAPQGLWPGRTLTLAGDPRFLADSLALRWEGAGLQMRLHVLAREGSAEFALTPPAGLQTVRVSLPGLWRVEQLEVRVEGTGQGRLEALSLAHTALGESRPVVLATGFRLRHLADVKIYEHLQALPRVYLVGTVRRVPAAAVLPTLADPAFDPEREVVVAHEEWPEDWPAATGPAGRVQIVADRPEHLVVRVEVDRPAVLVVTTSYYPGWTARLDGESVPLRRVNYLFQGISVPAGVHIVRLDYAPASLRAGLFLAAGTALGVLALTLGLGWRAGRARQL